jgi:hypothetical protein
MKPTADFCDRLLSCLGGPWPDPPPLDTKELSSDQVGTVRRLKIS